MMPFALASIPMKMASASPMITRPIDSVAIPIHMYRRIVRPRNATDRRPVKTQTEPGKQTIRCPQTVETPPRCCSVALW